MCWWKFSCILSDLEIRLEQYEIENPTREIQFKSASFEASLHIFLILQYDAVALWFGLD